jgi:hypothetical protein
MMGLAGPGKVAPQAWIDMGSVLFGPQGGCQPVRMISQPV